MTLPSPDATRRRRVQLGTTPELVPPDKYVPRYTAAGKWRPASFSDEPVIAGFEDVVKREEA